MMAIFLRRIPGHRELPATKPPSIIAVGLCIDCLFLGRAAFVHSIRKRFTVDCCPLSAMQWGNSGPWQTKRRMKMFHVEQN
jgi:hypothetical protein